MLISRDYFETIKSFFVQYINFSNFESVGKIVVKVILDLLKNNDFFFRSLKFEKISQ
jgi:hypothetical protein